MQGVWLEDLTWPEAKNWFDTEPVIVVPIGAVSKEHGHHLPLCTDYLLARGFGDWLVKALPVVVAPVISAGYYPAFRHYPGSQHLSPETFMAVLKDTLGGFIEQGQRNIVVLNTGISTEPLLNVTLREIYERTGVRVSAAHISRFGRSSDHIFEQTLGGHGDEHETSLIMVFAPERIRANKAAVDYGNVREVPDTTFYLPSVFNCDPESGIDFSKTGVRGDPTLATLEKGQIAVKAAGDDLVDGILKLYPDAIARGHNRAGQ